MYTAGQRPGGRANVSGTPLNDWRPILEWAPNIESRECTVERVQAIAFTPMDTTLRNELITRTYFDLAEHMATHFESDATWTTLGQWASHTIGSFLTLPVPVLGRVIARSFGHGNREVFADLGSAQALFLETVGEAAKNPNPNLVDDPDDRIERVRRALMTFRTRLRKILIVPPGAEAAAAEPFWETVGITDKHPDGEPRNRLLLVGFEAYAAAIVEDDVDVRSKLVLIGNCLLALHEQRILSLAISMGFRSWLRTLTRPNLLIGTQREWRNARPRMWRVSLEDRWIRFATKHFVRVDLPWASVPVGKPVPKGDHAIHIDTDKLSVRPLARRQFDIEELEVDDFLQELFDEFAVDGSPAKNWNVLGDRMAYIFALFAEHQRSPRWWNDDQPGNGLKVSKRRPEFTRQLATQLERMRIDTGREASSAKPSPMTDDELDVLRRKASYPLLDPGAGPVSMRGATDPAMAQFKEQVAANTRERLETLRKPGGLLDPATVRDARRMFEQNETLIFLGLFVRSLPDAYAAASGVQVISEVSDLAADPMRRASETAQFIADLLIRSSNFEDNGSAMQSIIGVRFMHSIAARHLEDADWNYRALGVPVNQEDVLATGLSFSVPVFEMFDVLGLRVDSNDRDAYVRFWLGIGHLMGAPIPPARTYDEGLALAQHIRRRHRARNLSGVRLTEGLVDGIGSGFLRGLGWMSPGLTAVLGDEEVIDLLMVEHGHGRTRSRIVAGVLRLGLGNRVTCSLFRRVISIAGERTLQPYFAVGSSRPFRRVLERGEGKGELITVIDRDPWPYG